jgi:hypothetical protein
MERFKKIPPMDMSEWFVRKDEQTTFTPNDWNLPLPWISAFIYTHLTANFWGHHQGEEANDYEQPRVLQIGCAQGGDAVENAKILKLPMINGKLHVIDWFKGNLTVDYDEEWAYNEENAPLWKAHLESEAKKFDVLDKITIFEGDSREVIHQMKDNYYDIVFIDGGHEYDIVKSDVENGYKKLKSGGVMVFDDFSGGYDSYKRYDIKNATEEMLQKDTYKFEDTLIHVGVVKAVHEFLNGNYIVCPTHDKAYHIKGYKIERESL